MSFPTQEQENLQRASEGMTTAGLVQEVVVATSRLLHSQPLTDRDRKALESCRTLLERLLSAEASDVSPSGERHLAASSTVALLRKSRATHPSKRDDLKETSQAIKRVLDGLCDEPALKRIEELRETFLLLGEENLASPGDSAQERSHSWTPLIGNSLS